MAETNEEVELPRCASRRAHDPHEFKSSKGGTVYCKGFDPTVPDDVADVVSGRSLGRLFERSEEKP